MNLKRVGTLVRTEVFHGPKDVILVMSVIIPVLLTLFVDLAFGNIFTDRASLGIYNEGTSRLPAVMQTSESITLKNYENEVDLKKQLSTEP